MGLLKIISGGQTGVDRGALDAALARGFPCGGWCPPGRMAEDGVIPDSYPLTEMKRGGYLERTIQNVIDADGTAVIHFGGLEGGTAQTVLHCKRCRKPYLLIDAEKISVSQAVAAIAAFVMSYAVAVLNVAGPRQSKAPGAHAYAFEVISRLLETAVRERSDSLG